MIPDYYFEPVEAISYLEDLAVSLHHIFCVNTDHAVKIESRVNGTACNWFYERDWSDDVHAQYSIMADRLNERFDDISVFTINQVLTAAIHGSQKIHRL